jgi:GTPase
VLVSAQTGEGLAELGRRIERELAHTLRRVELLVPYAEGGRLAELHDLADGLEREETAEGVRVTARVPAAVAARYERFAVNGRA